MNRERYGEGVEPVEEPDPWSPGGSWTTKTSPRIAFTTTEKRADGGTPLLLLHSLAVDQTTWGPVLEQLERTRQVITLDTRGHGASDSAADSGPRVWAEDIVAVLDTLAISQAVLVGVSMGGIQAIATAASAPDRVAGIVVADSFAALPEAVSAARIHDMTSYADAHSMDEVARVYVETTFLDSGDSRGAELVHTAMAAMTHDDYRIAVTACFGADVRDALDRVSAPTLVLWGALDAKTPRALSEAIVARIAGARLSTIPGAAHLSHLDQPALFAEHVRDFVDDLCRADPHRLAATSSTDSSEPVVSSQRRPEQ
jgi:pimeloyl-ACP methyl ester carboxylesterase